MRAIEARVLALAPWLLGVSLIVQFTLVAIQSRMTMIDLMVYRNGSPALFSGDLYDWRLPPHYEQFLLPFTYPPFAAIVFYPLSLLPWAVVRWGWQIVSVACLWWLVRGSLRLIARGDDVTTAQVWRRRAMVWTAIGLWLEPVRTTLNYGQINLVLAAIVLAAMAGRRSVLSGLGVGVTAGIKLTPAVSGIYFLATKRWAAAIWSAVVFAATVGLAYAISPAQSRRYWLHVVGETDRFGSVASVINQSLRAALSRTFGHDVGTGPIWVAGVVVAAALLFFALRAAVRVGDALAGVVAVQFFTLLISPISWSHHWVWIVPAVLWLVYGARGRLVAASAIAWLVATGSYLVSLLLASEDAVFGVPRALYVLLGWAYPACAVLTLVTIAVALRTTTATDTTEVSRPAPRRPPGRSRLPVPDPSA